MQWWEETWYAKNQPDITPRHKISCPVCHGYLGEREDGRLFQAHCEECRATFTFSPGDDIPSAKIDVKHKGCDCMSCRKDEPELATQKSTYILPDDKSDSI